MHKYVFTDLLKTQFVSISNWIICFPQYCQHNQRKKIRSQFFHFVFTYCTVGMLRHGHRRRRVDSYTERVSDSDFYKLWQEHRDGFGNINENLWLGNENIFVLTNSTPTSLRIAGCWWRIQIYGVQWVFYRGRRFEVPTVRYGLHWNGWWFCIFSVRLLTFFGSAWTFVFSPPPQWPCNDLRLWRIFILDFIHYFFIPS